MNEQGIGAPPPQEPRGPFSELNVPQANEFTVDEVIAAFEEGKPHPSQDFGEFIKKALAPPPHTPTRRRELLLQINQDTKHGYESLHLRGPVAIAKGEIPTLVLSLDNDLAFGFLFDVWALTQHGLQYYVAVKNPGQKDSKLVEAHLKPAMSIRDPNKNTLIVSEGLARQLAVQKGQDITITQVYLKPEEVNLDEI